MYQITERVAEWPRLEGLQKLIEFTNIMKYHVWVEEKMSGDLIVEANSDAEAKDKVMSNMNLPIDWNDEGGDFRVVDMRVCDEEN